MYEPQQPEEFNFKQKIAEDNILERAQAENLSTKNIALRQQHLKRLFFLLIGIGLGLGVVVAIGVLIAIQKLGLANKPYEIENPPAQEQIQNEQLENLDIEQN